ncbi:MAG: LuxR C-terminal-related transcriptional regulator, partial [Slackia sp.]|nr:LuxR C-terminal-related transcriptional regulator [Slackia sp.]
MFVHPSAAARSSSYAAIGLMLVFVWSSLTDHMFGLSESLHGAVNSRVFFLAGILAFCVVLIASPRLLAAKDASLKFLLPACGAMGTSCIAMAPHQTLFDAGLLCVFGLIALGIGYCWFVTRYGLFLARNASPSRIVYCIAAALIMEPIGRSLLESVLDHSALVCVAVAMPIVSMVLLRRAYRWACEEPLRAEREADGSIVCSRNESAASDEAARMGGALLPAASHPNGPIPAAVENPLLKRRFVLFFATALLLATVRTLSPVGTWDAEFDPAPMTSSFGLVAIYAVCTALFARFTLADAESKPPLSRFQLAFLLIVLTMLASIVLLYVQGPQSAVLYTLMCLNDSFAHLLFWTAVACMARSLPMPAYRIAGMGASAYAACSIAWLFLIGESEMMQTLATLAAIITLYVLTIVIVNTNGQHQTAAARGEAHKAHTGDAEERPEKAAVQAPPQDKMDAGALADRITASIEERCSEVAGDFGLSPRETDVLVLLAQGRTRLYVQEELVLSENTVKTHIGHIYRKLGVGNRQELLDLVFEKS